VLSKPAHHLGIMGGGKEPAIDIRLPPDLKSKVAVWASRQNDKPSLSEAIRRLLEKALAGTIASRQRSGEGAPTPAKMAARAIEEMGTRLCH
jgi:hypothetical protein